MTPTEALERIQDAFRHGRYFIDPAHAAPRMKARRVSAHDIKFMVNSPTTTEPYPGRATASPRTTCWRVIGQDLQGVELKVGIDLTVDHLGNFAFVATVM